MIERCPDHCDDEFPWMCACTADRIKALERKLADMTAQRDAWACECGTDNDWRDKVCAACGSDRPNSAISLNKETP